MFFLYKFGKQFIAPVFQLILNLAIFDTKQKPHKLKEFVLLLIIKYDSQHFVRDNKKANTLCEKPNLIKKK